MIIDAISGTGGGGGTTIVQKPTVTIGTYTYDGTEQGPEIVFTPSSMAKNCVITNATAINAGTYTLTIALKNTAKMVWDDITTADLTYTYTIGKATLTVPTVSDTSKTYNGSAQSPTISGFDSDLMTKSGDSATNAGSYTLSFGLVDGDNYQWGSSTTSFSWSIAKATLTVPTVSGAYTYDGTQKSATITGFDGNTMTKSGDETATNAGTYTVTFGLVDGDNYQYGTTPSGSWSIGKATITLPAVSNTSKTYNGSAQSPTIATYDTTKLTVSGNSATNAGNYTVVFALVDSDNYQMSGTNNVAWSIAKATPTVSLSTSSVSLNQSSTTAIITVTKSTNEAGAVTATSSNTSICTASVSGNTVTITRGNTAGSATVSISTQATSNWNAATASSVSVTNVNKPTIVTFANGTDAQIKAMLDAYYANDITWAEMGWAVGDTRKISLNAMTAPNPQGGAWNAQDITVVIVAHDHTDLATAVNGHTKACITVQMRECMNNLSDSSNTNGHIGLNASSAFTKWSSLYARTYINTTVLGAIPSGDFKSAIKVSKHYRHTDKDTSSAESVTDTLFLPSIPEYYGTYEDYTPTSPVEGTQFAYYMTLANRIKYGNNNGNSNGTAQWVWTSSPSNTTDAYRWCVDGTEGLPYRFGSSYKMALSCAWAM